MELRLSFDPTNGVADLATVSVGAALIRLADDGGLETAVLLSLFLERRANPDDLKLSHSARPIRALTDYLGGWWGDDFAEVDRDRVGSRLWTLQREKMLPQIAARARLYAREALAWIIEDGVADSVEVDAELGSSDTGLLSIAVRIIKGGHVAHRYEFVWSLLDAA